MSDDLNLEDYISHNDIRSPLPTQQNEGGVLTLEAVLSLAQELKTEPIPEPIWEITPKTYKTIRMLRYPFHPRPRKISYRRRVVALARV